MNLLIELFAELIDTIGWALSIIPSLILDFGSYLHFMAISVQHRNDDVNNDDEENND